ncbi:MAG: phosphate/phosphite/phosphonate ABC transporter substrate-binding protein [Nitrospiraceae bacterium]|nr:phosphate/phosphite/phosphonate ABC transporter substrate-binding protein [Nitrospiraceae bacterium]
MDKNPLIEIILFMRYRGMDSRRVVSIFLLISMIVFPISSLAAGKYEKPIVYFSAITLYHPLVMYQKYQPLMEYLSEHTPYRFELKLSQNYEDIIKFLKTNKVQVALLGGVTYLEAKRQFNVIPILEPLGRDGRPYYRSVFITQEGNTKINRISDLKGKSVAFASDCSTSGNLIPLYELYAKGRIRLEDLSKHVNLKYHDAVAREILRGEYEAGAVIDSVANKFKGKGLKIIHISDPIPGLPIVVRADVSPLVVKAIKKALLSLDYNNAGDRKVLNQFDKEFRFGFAEAKDSDYDSIRRKINYLKRRGVRIP